MQEKDRERETQLRLKEIEQELQVRLKELKVKSSASHATVDKSEGSVFDVSKHIKFVPTLERLKLINNFCILKKLLAV